MRRLIIRRIRGIQESECWCLSADVCFTAGCSERLQRARYILRVASFGTMNAALFRWHWGFTSDRASKTRYRGVISAVESGR